MTAVDLALYTDPAEALAAWEADYEAAILEDQARHCWVVGRYPDIAVGRGDWYQSSPEELEDLLPEPACQGIPQAVDGFAAYIRLGGYRPGDAWTMHQGEWCPLATYLGDAIVSTATIIFSPARAGGSSVIHRVADYPWIGEFLDLWDHPQAEEDKDMLAEEPERYLRRVVEQVERLAMHGLL